MAGFLQVIPPPAMGAARATAAMAGDWNAWAARSETVLGDAATGAQDSVVTGALNAFLAETAPQMRGISTFAEGQGNDLGQAVKIAVDTDETAAAVQQQVQAAMEAAGSTISRPINVG